MPNDPNTARAEVTAINKNDSALIPDIVREYFSGASDADAMGIAYEFTGFPCFWPDGPGTNTDKFRRQLAEAAHNVKQAGAAVAPDNPQAQLMALAEAAGAKSQTRGTAKNRDAWENLRLGLLHCAEEWQDAESEERTE